MKKWKRFEAVRNNEINLNSSVSAQIINALGENLPTSFLKKSPAKRTKHIMDTLSFLGRRLKFKSMSHGISKRLVKKGFKRSEWLYDLHWYEERKRKKYRQTSLPLAVECEWNWIREAERKKELAKKNPKKPDCYGAIKWDFQKLLVANADLRVMIFQFRVKDGGKLNRKLDEYFTETISGYRNLPPGSKFLFVAFDNSGFFYSEKSRCEL